MFTYYCKNCNTILGKWYVDEYKFYYISICCDLIKSKNINSIYFLDCKKCNKFVGLFCIEVCKTCFGEDIIFGEENLFKWLLKYKKTVLENLNCCKICNNKYYFRTQFWFFEELTFYK